MNQQCSHGIPFTEPCEQCDRIWETEVTDKLFLELSQFSKAKTRRELRLESINEALRSQVAELQRKLDGYEQAAKQEPVVEVRDNPDDYGFVYEWISESVLPWPGLKLYAAPANLPALIEQAKAEKEEELAVWIATQRNDVPATGEEFAAAIRARKP